MKLIEALTYPLGACQEVAAFWGKLDTGSDASMGIAASARPLMIASRFQRTPQPTLVVVAGEDAADEMARSISSYLGDGNVMRFRNRDDTPWGTRPSDAKTVACRMQALDALASGKDAVVVASARSLLRMMPPVGTPFFKPLHVDAGATVSSVLGVQDATFNDVPIALQGMGYQNTGELEGQGTYCVHGGIIDVFPGNLSYPVRIDFFGDDVDEIKRLVASTGQEIGSLDCVDIYPVREYVLSRRSMARARDSLAKQAHHNPAMRALAEMLEAGSIEPQADALLLHLYDKTAALGDFLGKDCLTIAVEPRSLIDDCLHGFDEIIAASAGTGIAPDGLYCDPLKVDLGSNQRCTYQSIMSIGATVDVEMPVKRTEVAGSSEKLFGRLKTFLDSGFVTVFSVSNYKTREQIKFELVDRGISIVEHVENSDNTESWRLEGGVVNIVDTPIPLGMVLPKAKLAVVSMSDTQGTSSARRVRQIDITQVTFPFAPGDYVVHAMHGVALFADVVRQDIDGVMRDYLRLEYADNDKLYVPVEQLDRVTRYVGPEGASPRLTRLNTSDWSRALSRARKASKKLAFDLVDVYTRRASAQGHRYGPDTPWQHEMEESFPYQETPDQLAAIADVKADMQSSRPMDRLVCGDVGFGKTEVALRAAFKAVQGGKQVMVLCPTTILAQQHYATFCDRFEDFGVEVRVMSRFRTPAQQQEALEGFSSGTVDVMIGTHRLLSRDVNPKDLGLVIIDEEQRFGVGHKEQLKNLRESVDVLTLSATPIPRTMQMSLSGVRDMSLILTPPDDRRPVEVHVGEWDPDVVSGAIRRELERGGQVYYVSNRVRSIEDAVSRVHEAAGEARVGVAHGQMGKDELERVMEEFSAGNIDVLVATTIIESGIDNPHTNTLIIEDAQRLGLAQMYQLKGRVGRSNRQAYAYFMFPENVSLTEEAVSRLIAINEHQDLGSGMRIAMRDLEIRGAGSLLGAEQSGNMSAVGFDLFAQMIATAVTEAREGISSQGDVLPKALSDITVNIPVHAYLPEDYIPNADERVMLYRQIAYAAEVREVDRLEQLVGQSHANMPDPACNLFAKARVRALANACGVQIVTVVAGKLIIEPLRKPAGEIWAELRRSKARYIAASSKLQVPLEYFKLDSMEGILGAAYDLIETVMGTAE